MIQWAAGRYLYLLLLLPVLLGLIILIRVWSQKRWHRQIEPALLRRLNPDRSPALTVMKTVCLLLAIALLIIAIARPRWGRQLQMFKARGVAVVVALDASKSMLAEDVKPNRLQRAKTELAALFDELTGNAVGVVGFAGDAYALCPLTTDVEAAKMFLDIISPDLMPVPGTDFGRAIDVALNLFNPGAASRVLILVTDGEDLGTNTEAAVQRAKEAGVRIYPVAFATAEGAPIPEKGEAGVVYKKDRAGNVVVSRMDERKLILIAQATGGRFYRVEGFSGTRLAGELDRLQKEELAGGSFSDYVERYQIFLLAGIVFLFIALVLPERRPGLAGLVWSLTKVRAKLGTAVFVLTLLGVGQAPADLGSLMRAGNSHFRRGKFEEALAFYQRAEVLEPDALAIHYNIGNTLYRLGRYNEALAELTLATVDKNPGRRAHAWYNTGNTFYRMDRLDEAINAYKMALLANPNDRQAKENLEFCLKKKAERQQQPDATPNQPQTGGGEQQKEKQKMQQPRPQSGIDRDQAERILKAIENKERETQKQTRRPRAKRQVEKDW